MDEIWFVVEIYPKDYANQGISLILDFVKPTVKSLDGKNLAKTFHFLFEPGHLLFRARTHDIEAREKVKSIVNENITKIKDVITRVELKDDYSGEQEQFGTEGWLYVQKLLEYASRISLLTRETFAEQKPLTACRLDREYNTGKLVHCFLNAQGFSTIEEAHFHNEANIERLLRAYGFFDVADRLHNLEKKVINREQE
ncbi:hypothetical protein ES703_66144 [subsurface metagenome]